MRNVIGNVLDAKHRPAIIPHVVNDSGAMGSGVALAILKKYPSVEKLYRNWYKECNFDGYNYIDVTSIDEVPVEELEEIPFKLGQIQIIKVKKDLYIANMIGQSTPGGTVVRGVPIPPIRLTSLMECMLRVAEFCDFYQEQKKQELEIHAPWFGTLRAGSDKPTIQKMIEEYWSDLNVTMYDFEEKR